MTDTDVLLLPTSAVVSNVQFFAPILPAVGEISQGMHCLIFGSTNQL